MSQAKICMTQYQHNFLNVSFLLLYG